MIIETEVFGFTVKGVPFEFFPGWLQLATGLPIVLGIILACAAGFILAPRQLKRGGSTATADKMVEGGVIMSLAGLVSILVTALLLP